MPAFSCPKTASFICQKLGANQNNTTSYLTDQCKFLEFIFEVKCARKRLKSSFVMQNKYKNLFFLK